MNKKMLIWVVSVILTGAMTITAYGAGWDRDEKGYWYLFENNAYARNQIVAIDGVNYAFDSQAYMVTGWYNAGGFWYYFSPDTGAQVTGWLQLDGKWYYCNPDNGGIMQRSWMNLGKKLYYFDENGILQVGAFTVDGYYYFAEADGSVRRNTSETENGITIRYDENGMQWYRNEENVINGKNGGDVWLPVLEESALLQQRMEIQSSNEAYINDEKDELWEKFKQEISKSKTKSSRDRRIEKWKEKANRQLSKLSVPQQEIDAYVAEVVKARYGGDMGSWTYTYTEEHEDGSSTVRTYTYRYGDPQLDVEEDEDESENYDDDYFGEWF